MSLNKMVVDISNIIIVLSNTNHSEEEVLLRVFCESLGFFLSSINLIIYSELKYILQCQ